MNLSGTTHWYRNLAYTEKRRVLETTEEEAASRALEEALAHVCRFVKKTFKMKVGRQQFEIDVIARFGHTLFIFECKHPLLPCNMHELRTSFDHMKKGAVTLTRIADMLKAEGAEKDLYRRLGWDVEEAKKIVTCIVSCNGMFPGLLMDGHPIRRFKELRNMIQSGTIRVTEVNADITSSDPSDYNLDVREVKLWEGPELTPEFLQRYINDELIHGPTFRSMRAWEKTYRLGDTKLAFSTFVLDPVALGENLAKVAKVEN